MCKHILFLLSQRIKCTWTRGLALFCFFVFSSLHSNRIMYDLTTHHIIFKYISICISASTYIVSISLNIIVVMMIVFFVLVFSCFFLLLFFLCLVVVPFAENEEDTLNNQVDQDSSTILNECKRDASKRRPSLAQKMTSNLRRLSGATELKIDIHDSISANNSKYCNKKIKVGIYRVSSAYGYCCVRVWDTAMC